MKLFLIAPLLAILVFGCTPAQKEITFKKADEITIEDSEPYIGELYNVKFINKNHFFTYDNRANVKEFKNYKSIKVWGKTGKGPCEHGSLNDFTVYQNSPFMLDREQGKYLAYG